VREFPSFRRGFPFRLGKGSSREGECYSANSKEQLLTMAADAEVVVLNVLPRDWYERT